MADRNGRVDALPVLRSMLGSSSHSTRKRRAGESYANSQSSDDYVNKQSHPAKKRKKASPAGILDVGCSKPSDGSPAELFGDIAQSKSKSTTYVTAIDYASGCSERDVPSEGASKLKAAPSFEDEDEKRLKRYKPKLPKSFMTIMERAVTQRMFVIDRKRHDNMNCPHSTPNCPMEIVDLAGTTGNCYQVVITHCPTCTCPNFVKGNPQCKHILYVLLKVLKVTGDLQYQSAFLTSELREIFDTAGPLPSDTVASEDKDGKRKPVEGDCPICVEDLDTVIEEIVWCRAACGNNLHKTCFDQWAASKRGDKVTCPYCRTPWETGVNERSIKAVSKTGAVNEDGYVNIAGELGIDGRRDYSTYHSAWVRAEHRAGRIDGQHVVPHSSDGYHYGNRYRRRYG